MVLGDWGVPSKYMSYIVPTSAEQVPAVTHVDGTSRPQIVAAGDDPFILKLLSAWRHKTGLRPAAQRVLQLPGATCRYAGAGASDLEKNRSGHPRVTGRNRDR